MFHTRRGFLRSLSATALVLSLEDVLALAIPPQQAQPEQWASKTSRPEYNAPARPAPKALPSPIAGTPLGVTFIDVARQSGLNAKTIYGSEHKNKYLLETTGCGVAFYDYDHDDWIDIFLVNGTRLEGFPKGQEPISHLFKNNRDGTFTDVTIKAGLARADGARAAVSATTTTTDGTISSSATTDRTFSTEITEMAPSPTSPRRRASFNRRRAGTPAAPSLTTTATAISTSSSLTTSTSTSRPPHPEAAGCAYKGIQVACGPPGLQGGKNILYHNNGDGTFTDVSEKPACWTPSAPMVSALPSPTSTTTAGPTSTSPTTPPPPPSTKTRKTAPSKT